MSRMRWDAVTASESPERIQAANRQLAGMDARERIRWAIEHLPCNHVLSSSFGVQAAVSLHLVTRELPSIPVILIDTGYLFPETYRFVDQLVVRLDLDLRVYQPTTSPAWLEARHGRLWEQGREGIERYNHLRKLEPMQRALAELGVGTWFAGLRRDQARTRQGIEPLEYRDGTWKLHPIFDWSDGEVFAYLRSHQLPQHPLWHEGYVSIGDWHTTRSLAEAGDEEATRFFGLKRECGLHGLDG